MLPRVGDTLNLPKKHYVLKKQLGQGSFGVVFLIYVYSREQRHWKCALKVESLTARHQMLANEAAMLKRLECRNSHIVVSSRAHEYGSFRYIRLQLLGQNLDDARRSMPGQRFSVATVLQIASQTLIALERLQEMDVLHCDIKPANILIGRKDVQNVYLTDFGLAQTISDRSGKYGGTLRYMSRACQAKQVAGANDDLEAWLYSMVKLVSGTLPWDGFQAKYASIILYWKQACFSDYRFKQRLLRRSPPVFDWILNYMKQLTATSKIEYWLIQLKLQKYRACSGIAYNTPLDWDPDHPYTGLLYGEDDKNGEED